MHSRITFRHSFLLFLFGVVFTLSAQRSPDVLTPLEIEQFLLNANVTSERELAPGVMRLGLDDGKRKHDAQARIIGSESPGEDPRLDVVAYELDKLLELQLVPPAVERSLNGKPAIIVWRVEDVAMAELDRRRKKIDPPDQDRWNKQLQAVRVFDELISNAYRNVDPQFYLTTLWDNLLITRDWRVWIIDYKQSFRSNKQLEHPETLTRCDRTMLAALRTLNKRLLQQKLEYLSNEQIDALDFRRELLVKHFAEQIASKGESAVLFDLSRDR